MTNRKFYLGNSITAFPQLTFSSIEQYYRSLFLYLSFSPSNSNLFSMLLPTFIDIQPLFSLGFCHIFRCCFKCYKNLERSPVQKQKNPILAMCNRSQWLRIDIRMHFKQNTNVRFVPVQNDSIGTITCIASGLHMSLFFFFCDSTTSTFISVKDCHRLWNTHTKKKFVWTIGKKN